MNMKRRALAPLLLMLGACAHQGVSDVKPAAELPPDGTTTSYVGVAVDSIQPKSVGDYMSSMLGALDKTLAASETRQWQSSQLADGSIRLQAWTATGFEAGSAELRPAMLDGLARIARVVKSSSKTTVHVLVSGYDNTAAAFSQSLADRRAATLAAYLVAQGVDDRRTRFEGSAKSQPGLLQITIRPVIAGAEAQAWMSPP